MSGTIKPLAPAPAGRQAVVSECTSWPTVHRGSVMTRLETVESFAAWLRGQRHRQDPVGDLARDVARDRGHRVTTPAALLRRVDPLWRMRRRS